MTLVSWAKKELARLYFQSPKRLLPPQTTLKPSAECVVASPISEVTMAADLRCMECQDRVASILSTIDNDLESIVVHVVEKKVTLTRKRTISL
ncbi:hypothetical protein BUALT_Bualt07G0080600 [Buddleja alternifolia]|uniref:HMA domain-containing protein n=1 Tax=Buddleja alternifolia TaxID=168488 RepID=A0AAV6X8C3_9LAMI|nr:hypothetical protein BUALT_Bualt07G0080600 [Buddleja alternifolia]